MQYTMLVGMREVAAGEKMKNEDLEGKKNEKGGKLV